MLMMFSASCINLKDATKADSSTTTEETAKKDAETTTATEEKNKENTTTEKETTKTTEGTKKADTTTDAEPKKTTEGTKTNNKIKPNANAPKFDKEKLLKQIKDLKDKDIDFENTEVLPELKEKMAKFACIGRMKEVISFMSKSEQMAPRSLSSSGRKNRSIRKKKIPDASNQKFSTLYS